MKGKTIIFLEPSTNFQGSEFIPKSAACSCPKVCDCQTTKMRKRECARAYLGTSCDNCNSYFTSLIDTGFDENVSIYAKEFPSKWRKSVSSILVRKSCSLQLQVENDGAAKRNVKIENLDQGNDFNLAQQWKVGQQITGYDCYCNAALVPKHRASKNSTKLDYPKMVKIPKSPPDIISLLSQPEMRSHPGVLAALQSLKNRRSPNTAYILLLGLTGSGKSTAINMLFDHPNITNVGGMSSTTTDIHEFSIRVKSRELGIDNSELRVIDTPGTGDTRGLTQDSRFLATLDKFISNHQDLKDRVPNIVLIFSKFHENRYQKDGAPFVKMLRTIEIFKDQLIDSQFTNVIFVLSHYMSETKDITRNSKEKIERIRKVVEEFSTLPKPINIVVAENKPELAQLQSINGYYELPNGEFYPRNLFAQIQKTLLTASDPIGESVIRQGFKNSDNFQIFSKNYPLVPETDPAVTRYFWTITSFDLPINSTQVSSCLSESFEHTSQELKAQYPGTLLQLQRSLYKKNIYGIQDVPKTTPEILRLFRDIITNPLSIHLLKNGLSLTFPTLGSHISVGYGYDLVSNQPFSSPLLQIEEE